jgi:hypothetical protein
VSVEQRLADMRDRSEKATPGPWEATGLIHPNNERVGIPLVQSPTGWPAQCFKSADSWFIAHARTDLDDLRGAVEDVLALAEEWDAIPDQVLVRRAATIRLRRAITARLGGA